METPCPEAVHLILSDSGDKQGSLLGKPPKQTPGGFGGLGGFSLTCALPWRFGGVDGVRVVLVDVGLQKGHRHGSCQSCQALSKLWALPASSDRQGGRPEDTFYPEVLGSGCALPPCATGSLQPRHSGEAPLEKAGATQGLLAPRHRAERRGTPGTARLAAGALLPLTSPRKGFWWCPRNRCCTEFGSRRPAHHPLWKGRT